MALRGFWGLGMGRVPDICTPSDRASVVTFDDQDDGLPSYAPYGMYPGTNDTIWWDTGDAATIGDEFIVGWWGRYTATNSSRGSAFALQQSTTNNHILVQLYGSTDRIRISSATSGIGTPVVDFGDLTSPDGLDLNAWNFYELGVRWSDTAGTVRLRINGQTPTGWTDQSSVDTQPAAPGDTSLGTNFWQRNGATWFGIASGVYALDSSGLTQNDFLGVCRMPLLSVTSDSEADFLGSDGNSIDNYLLIDEAPGAIATNTDYVESSTSADRQRCGVESLAALQIANIELVGVVEGVSAVGYGADPAAGGQTVEVGIVSGASEDVGTITMLDDPEFGALHHVVVNDPATSLPWDPLALESMTALVEVP